jgi:hypothetical protein
MRMDTQRLCPCGALGYPCVSGSPAYQTVVRLLTGPCQAAGGLSVYLYVFSVLSFRITVHIIIGERCENVPYIYV